MEFAGGSNNAFTGDDMTGYTDWFPAAALEPMIAMEADRMQGSIFDPKVLESERRVVASERRMGVENNNDAILGRKRPGHGHHGPPLPLGRHRLDERHPELEARRDHRLLQDLLRPNNAVLILVGDFETAKALDLIDKYYAAIPAGPPPPAVTTVEPPQIGAQAGPRPQGGPGPVVRHGLPRPAPAPRPTSTRWPSSKAPCSAARAAASTSAWSATSSWPSTSAAGCSETHRSPALHDRRQAAARAPISPASRP